MSENSPNPNPSPQPAGSQSQDTLKRELQPPPKPNGNGRLQSPAFLWMAGIGLTVLLYFGIGYLISSYTSETTDDAFIAGHIVSIAPRISGQVAAVHVLDNEFVHSNQLLVELDP
ncbi:MAG TPA: biotin/lipoyl-binding protein, partial [Candidatus Acidoferrum sp.]|nr:biotin/lipoyl-binding protein [Candidatus Acidoferrum sp.]